MKLLPTPVQHLPGNCTFKTFRDDMIHNIYITTLANKSSSYQKNTKTILDLL